MLLLNLNEIDRVKKLNHISSNVELAKRTNLSRKTWSAATSTRKPTIAILQALSTLGADPKRLLVREDLPGIAA